MNVFWEYKKAHGVTICFLIFPHANFRIRMRAQVVLWTGLVVRGGVRWKLPFYMHGNIDFSKRNTTRSYLCCYILLHYGVKPGEKMINVIIWGRASENNNSYETWSSHICLKTLSDNHFNFTWSNLNYLYLYFKLNYFFCRKKTIGVGVQKIFMYINIFVYCCILRRKQEL